VLTVIEAHASADNEDNQRSPNGAYPPSEANAVIRKFLALSDADKQAIPRLPKVAVTGAGKRLLLRLL
jgi:hypothetical protein